jgi:hypothetical protein
MADAPAPVLAPPTEREVQIMQALNQLQAQYNALQAASSAPAPSSGQKAPKIPAPDKYSGPPKGDVSAFVAQLKHYVLNCANDDERKKHASLLLTGNAYKWHTAHSGSYSTFDAYCEALLAYGTDPRKHQRAVSKLRLCKQAGRKVLQYNSDFTAISLDLESGRWPEEVLLDVYLDGLDSQVRSHVEAHGRPANLQAAQQAAHIAAGESFTPSAPSAKKLFPKTPYVAKNVRFQEPQPMEIGTLKGGKKATSWPPPHPPNKPCTVCGKGLHWAVECPVVKAASTN